MDCKHFKQKLLKCDNINDCDQLISNSYNKIYPYFYGHNNEELDKAKYEIQDLFDEVFFDTNLGREVNLSNDIPESIISLLILFASFFERVGMYSAINDINQILPNCSIKSALKALYEYKKIYDITENFTSRFNTINVHLHSSYLETNKKLSTNILAEYYLTAITTLLKNQYISIAEEFRLLFAQTDSLKSFPLVNSRKLKDVMGLEFSNVDKLNSELQITNILISEGLFKEASKNFKTYNTINEESDTEPLTGDSEKLPEYLENKLFDGMGAVYQRINKKITQGLMADYEQNTVYLGTYFPRTFVEIYNISHSLISNSVIRRSNVTPKRMNILDIGSGTGGCLIGLLESLAAKNLIDSNINITSIDGNSVALDYQREIVKCFEQKHDVKLSYKQIKTCFSTRCTDFEKELSKELNKFDRKMFDVIIASKFISEFYVENYSQAIGTYKVFANIVSKYLTPLGCLIILDVTTKDNKFEWQPIVMNNELNQFIESENTFSYILPLSCALWHKQCKNADNCYTQKIYKVSHRKKLEDRSKVTFKIIVHKDFADSILDNIEHQEMYKINSANKNMICRLGKLKMLKNNFNVHDGFQLNAS